MQNYPLVHELLLSVIFGGVGLAIMYVAFILVSHKINLRKELIEDENIAIAIMFAGFFIAISLIISAAIR